MSRLPHAAVLLVLLCASAPLRAEEPLQAGSGGVPIPKRTKTVRPEYPPEAQARGMGGIVILELVVDTAGKVASVQVVRSVPPFDQAAVAAARQWEYEVTKVNGKAVSVRLSVPISFMVKVPEMKDRQSGIPELRQGLTPVFPPEAREQASVTAELTLDTDGQVADAQVMTGTMPFSAALLQALRTWRFVPDGSNAVISFRVQADFVPASKGSPARVDLRLSGLHRSEAPALSPAPTPAPGLPSPSPPPAPAPGEPPAVAPRPEPSPTPTTAPVAPAPSPVAPAAPAPVPPSPLPGPSPAASPKPAPPPVETLAPPPPETPAGTTPPAVTESGVSAIRDVTLSDGVPDLSKGRRPSPPPLARMAGTTGTVEVHFAVNAAGITSVQSVEGPDLLKPAAQGTVTSWVFRRASAMRLHLLAVFTFRSDSASAAVRPE